MRWMQTRRRYNLQILTIQFIRKYSPLRGTMKQCNKHSQLHGLWSNAKSTVGFAYCEAMRYKAAHCTGGLTRFARGDTRLRRGSAAFCCCAGKVLNKLKMCIFQCGEELEIQDIELEVLHLRCWLKSNLSTLPNKFIFWQPFCLLFN